MTDPPYITCFDCDESVPKEDIKLEERVYEEGTRGPNGGPPREGLVPVCPGCYKGANDGQENDGDYQCPYPGCDWTADHPVGSDNRLTQVVVTHKIEEHWESHNDDQ